MGHALFHAIDAISARDPETGLVAIKPSGIMYEDLQPEDHVVVDLEGDIVEGTLKPSSDTASHLYIYRHRPGSTAPLARADRRVVLLDDEAAFAAEQADARRQAAAAQAERDARVAAGPAHAVAPSAVAHDTAPADDTAAAADTAADPAAAPAGAADEVADGDAAQHAVVEPASAGAPVTTSDPISDPTSETAAQLADAPTES